MIDLSIAALLAASSGLRRLWLVVGELSNERTNVDSTFRGELRRVGRKILNLAEVAAITRWSVGRSIGKAVGERCAKICRSSHGAAGTITTKHVQRCVCRLEITCNHRIVSRTGKNRTACNFLHCFGFGSCCERPAVIAEFHRPSA